MYITRRIQQWKVVSSLFLTHLPYLSSSFLLHIYLRRKCTSLVITFSNEKSPGRDAGTFRRSKRMKNVYLFVSKTDDRFMQWKPNESDRFNIQSLLRWSIPMYLIETFVTSNMNKKHCLRSTWTQECPAIYLHLHSKWNVWQSKRDRRKNTWNPYGDCALLWWSWKAYSTIVFIERSSVCVYIASFHCFHILFPSPDICSFALCRSSFLCQFVTGVCDVFEWKLWKVDSLWNEMWNKRKK